ncbi:MAG: HdeD family acid-resistance protein [Pseudomonadota bacterium]
MASIPLLTQSWSIFALRGVIALLLAGFALLAPGITLLSLIAVFAAYALLAGAVSVVGALRHRQSDRNWWLLMVLGLVSVAAGVLAVMRPALAALALVMVIGANAMVTGVLEIVLAVRVRNHVQGEWLLVLSGAVSLVFGAMLLLYPGAGALAVVWLVGLYATITGVLYLALAWRAYRGTARKRAEEVADTKVAYAGPAAVPGAAADAAVAGAAAAGAVGRSMPTLERRVAERRMRSATSH